MSARNLPVDQARSTRNREFRAFGGLVRITAVGVEEAQFDECVQDAAVFAEEWEQCFSRFRPESELSRLNDSGPAGSHVSAVFIGVLDAALTAWRRSGGRFDPGLQREMVAIGYNRDFTLMQASDISVRPLGRTSEIRSLDELTIDRKVGLVRLSSGRGLDFGGLAKGIFVDRLAKRFNCWPGGCVNAGGDLRVWGTPPNGDHWVVGVEDPFNMECDRCRIVVTVPALAVATSALNRRAWTSGGQRLNHLIDPNSGRPVAGRLVSVTAVAADLQTAEVTTKAMLVASSRGEPLDLLDAATAVIIDESNNVLRIGGTNDRACQIFAVNSASGAA